MIGYLKREANFMKLGFLSCLIKGLVGPKLKLVDKTVEQVLKELCVCVCS